MADGSLPDSPFPGPGSRVQAALDHRAKKVEECNAAGPPSFEMVLMPGYSTARMRCTRCKRLKRHHK